MMFIHDVAHDNQTTAMLEFIVILVLASSVLGLDKLADRLNVDKNNKIG